MSPVDDSEVIESLKLRGGSVYLDRIIVDPAGGPLVESSEAVEGEIALTRVAG